MSIGEQLKEAREKLGFDERSASDRTHIRRHYIIAMENDDFDTIDLAPVYRIGFLRIYAKLLKLDANALVAEYRDSLKGKNGASRNIFRPASRNASDDADDSAFGSESGEGRTLFPRSPKALALAGVIALALVCGVILFSMKSCDSEVAGTPKESVESETENGVAYEIELTAKASQKITIYENYKGWDNDNRRPIAGKIVLGEHILEGRTKKLTVHGSLYIQEEIPGGCDIKFPSASAFETAAPGKTVVFAPNDKPRNLSGTKARWLLVPVSEKK